MAKSNNHRHSFYLHLGKNLGIVFFLTAAVLFIGMCGYHYFENMQWIDAFLNAAMILSGMGPAANLASFEGKLFAGCYALFSGLAFIAIIVMILSPLIHYIFRKVHVESSSPD